jgi:dephospho-CoA kinase
MVIIGLTGGIASGKSTVAAMLAEKGAVILDADRMARELVEPGKAAWQEIVQWLGRDFMLEDGSIDRERLGRLVFQDAEARRKLNAIIHPRVGQEMAARTGQLRNDCFGSILVYDVPLLIEAGMQDMADLILLVYVPEEIQLQRLQRRDNLSREEALLRIRAQMPLKEKKKHAHAVIDNSGTLTDTALQVDEFWERALRNRPEPNGG